MNRVSATVALVTAAPAKATTVVLGPLVQDLHYQFTIWKGGDDDFFNLGGDGILHVTASGDPSGGYLYILNGGNTLTGASLWLGGETILAGVTGSSQVQVVSKGPGGYSLDLWLTSSSSGTGGGISPVPEPATSLLVGAGLALLFVRRRGKHA